MRLAHQDVCAGHALAVERVTDGGGELGGHGVQLVLVLLYQQNTGHDFGQTGGGQRFLAVLFVYDDVGVGIHDVGSLAGDFEGGLKPYRPGGQRENRGHKNQGEQKRDEFFHVDFSF